MKAEIENAIKTLVVKRITAELKADEALKFTQAVLNLAHTLATLTGAQYLENSKPPVTPPAGGFQPST